MNRFLQAADKYYSMGKIPVDRNGNIIDPGPDRCVYKNGKPVVYPDVSVYWELQDQAIREEANDFEKLKASGKRPNVVNLMHFRILEQKGELKPPY